MAKRIFDKLEKQKPRVSLEDMEKVMMTASERVAKELIKVARDLVSADGLDIIIEAVENTKDLMSIGAEFKRLGVKYEVNLPDPPIPPHIIASIGGKTFTLVNKKYAAGRPDYVKGHIAVYKG